MKRQLICSIKIRHRWRHDSVDFVPLLYRACRMIPSVGVILAGRGYDSEKNHVAAESMGVQKTLIRPRLHSLQVCKTRGLHRKQMKRQFDSDTYHHRNKAETIFSVIKRMLGEDVMSRTILTQNREIMYRVIAYNCYRITRNSLLIWMVSTGPIVIESTCCIQA